MRLAITKILSVLESRELRLQVRLFRKLLSKLSLALLKQCLSIRKSSTLFSLQLFVYGIDFAKTLKCSDVSIELTHIKIRSYSTYYCNS